MGNHGSRRQVCLEEEDPIGIEDYIRVRPWSEKHNWSQRDHTRGTSKNKVLGNHIPRSQWKHLGEVKLEGIASIGNPIKMKTQVADVTQPLAATSEMVDAGNLVVIHKQGGMIKHLSKKSQDNILEMLKAETGLRYQLSARAMLS